LSIWCEQIPESAVDFRDHIHYAQQRLSEMSVDIQELSHRLHSSKLEYLGLVSAAKSFCMEVSEKQGVQVEFVHSDIPQALPSKISLCLFRVLQQALQNAVRHSGSPQVKVEIRGSPDEIQLMVSDLGIGFDPREAINSRGIGLISMQERLGLVNGRFSINSARGRGATVFASVPISSNGNSLQ
jgi:signal transduction histidine kinase